MKHVYARFFSVTILLLFLLIFSHLSYAQCPNGQTGGQTAYDTTIVFGSGIVATQVKFPKFDPLNGMVTCVKLCVTIKGIIDTVALENFTNAPQTGSYTYSRNDTITGPGIPTYLTSNANLSFGPFPLAATNGVFGSGPDFYSHGSDTVLTKVLCANISDSATIGQFYGVNDSVTYNYTIDANAIGIVTGGSSLTFVLSSGLVNFHFQYCTCPPAILPLDILEFSLTKLAADRAELKWTEAEDPFSDYHYEAQVSRNGHDFASFGSAPKNTISNDPYRITYRAVSGENGVYYFRVKQVYSNGYTRFSNIKQVTLENSDFPKFTLSPNPSNGIVGIKFDNITSGRFNIQIYNTQGQTMVKKDLSLTGSSYVQVASLERGVYWLRLTDVKSQASCVNQLLIK
ncbi:MAG: T9SS type A sorting domain-containing protein [Bacteroidota bacterium]|nr:T9SS type A sorting domain-containing protein [Bacteroidota bacterium]